MAPGVRESVYFFDNGSPKGAFLVTNMAKITEYYLNKASYMAIDEDGNRVDVTIDYWNGSYEVKPKNPELEEYAKKLIKNKHKVNFVHKLQTS